MRVGRAAYFILYEKLFLTFASREAPDRLVTIKDSNVWDTLIDSVEKAPPLEEEKKRKAKESAYRARREFGSDGADSHRYFYRAYSNLKNSDLLEIEVNDGALYNALKYLGYKHNDESKLNPLERVQDLYLQFLPEAKEEILNRKGFLETIPEAIPLEYVPLIRHLVNCNWWFCFRGHPIDRDINLDGWVMVHNVMKFEVEDTGLIKVSKLKKKIAEKYGDCHGAIDFRASGPNVLSINVEREKKEHCHIKINIDEPSNVTRDLYLGEFLQYE